MKIYKIKILVHFYIFNIIISTILNFPFAVECQDLDFGLESQDPNLELWIRSHKFFKFFTQDCPPEDRTSSFDEFPIFTRVLFYL
jgi:hypothetical protein